MDRDTALTELPPAHAVALRLRDAGASEQVIAQALDVPEEAVAQVLEVASRKLELLLDVADLERTSASG